MTAPTKFTFDNDFDAPLSDVINASAPALLAELESPSLAAPCAIALTLGEASKHWVDGLRSVFEQARMEAPAVRFSSRLCASQERLSGQPRTGPGFWLAQPCRDPPSPSGT